VDVLVHDMSGFTAEQLAEDSAAGRVRRAAAQLLATPEQAGDVFTRSHCRLAVLSHYTHDAAMIERVRGVYRGPLEPAEDMTRVDIGEQLTIARK
jgi:ribonuclease BN (tRNA processing enzyme)